MVGKGRHERRGMAKKGPRPLARAAKQQEEFPVPMASSGGGARSAASEDPEACPGDSSSTPTTAGSTPLWADGSASPFGNSVNAHETAPPARLPLWQRGATGASSDGAADTPTTGCNGGDDSNLFGNPTSFWPPTFGAGPSLFDAAAAGTEAAGAGFSMPAGGEEALEQQSYEQVQSKGGALPFGLPDELDLGTLGWGGGESAGDAATASPAAEPQQQEAEAPRGDASSGPRQGAHSFGFASQGDDSSRTDDNGSAGYSDLFSGLDLLGGGGGGPGAATPPQEGTAFGQQAPGANLNSAQPAEVSGTAASSGDLGNAAASDTIEGAAPKVQQEKQEQQQQQAGGVEQQEEANNNRPPATRLVHAAQAAMAAFSREDPFEFTVQVIQVQAAWRQMRPTDDVLLAAPAPRLAADGPEAPARALARFKAPLPLWDTVSLAAWLLYDDMNNLLIRLPNLRMTEGGYDALGMIAAFGCRARTGPPPPLQGGDGALAPPPLHAALLAGIFACQVTSWADNTPAETIAEDRALASIGGAAMTGVFVLMTAWSFQVAPQAAYSEIAWILLGAAEALMASTGCRPCTWSGPGWSDAAGKVALNQLARAGLDASAIESIVAQVSLSARWLITNAPALPAERDMALDAATMAEGAYNAAQRMAQHANANNAIKYAQELMAASNRHLASVAAVLLPRSSPVVLAKVKRWGASQDPQGRMGREAAAAALARAIKDRSAAHWSRYIKFEGAAGAEDEAAFVEDAGEDEEEYQQTVTVEEMGEDEDNDEGAEADDSTTAAPAAPSLPVELTPEVLAAGAVVADVEAAPATEELSAAAEAPALPAVLVLPAPAAQEAVAAVVTEDETAVEAVAASEVEIGAAELVAAEDEATVPAASEGNAAGAPAAGEETVGAAVAAGEPRVHSSSSDSISSGESGSNIVALMEEGWMGGPQRGGAGSIGSLDSATSRRSNGAQSPDACVSGGGFLSAIVRCFRSRRHGVW